MNRQALIKQLEAHEGYRDQPYTDTLGIWTVAYGHNIHEHELARVPAQIRTVGELLEYYSDKANHRLWFHRDINEAIEQSDRWISHDRLSEIRQRVLTEMFFVLGASRARKFVKFKAAVDADDHHAAAAELINSRWHTQATRRVAALAEQWAEG